ncbi:MAG TPA: tRNA (adenosine(37)-N6)-dimethylallyltransferase MiaA [Candidatus Methylomirabilis sp.]|nr:tRNA (adenosine(37)-N6)-dimethylallyltransferase MiaA [Candidatus Methylomirabilis sp.]
MVSLIRYERMEIQTRVSFPNITGEGVSLSAGMDKPIELEKLVEIVTQDVPHSAALRAGSRHALPRVVFVVGPTSSGKTDLGLRLAKEFGGEIVNADARQIYRDLSIGTGKPSGKRSRWKGHTAYMVDGVPHYLMDFLPPDKTYTVAQWREAALRAVKGMVKRGALPIVVGGTGLYVSALIDNYRFPAVAPQPALRKAYEEKSLDELVRLLLVVDPGASGVVDLKNKRRVIRALEVVTYTGRRFSEQRTQGEPLVEAFQVGIHLPKEELFRRIDRSIESMVDEGLIDEARSIFRRGFKPNLPSMTSIGYQEIARYLRGEASLEEALALVKKHTHQYTKRQWTWFKRDPRIRWASSEDEAVEMVGEWLGGSS